MTFVQIIDYETDRADEMKALVDQWMARTEGKRTVVSEMHGEDHDKPGHYVDIIEFPSYDQAMANSKMPETQQMAAQLKELCTAGPRFLNLDVMTTQG